MSRRVKKIQAAAPAGDPSAWSKELLWFSGMASLLIETLGLVLRLRIRWRQLIQQIWAIGIGSQLVVMVSGAFTGAVFAAQTYFKFNELGLATATGPVVSIAMCRELGPVLAGLMVAGRTGAAMAAEIGTMKVREQLDALRAMGVSPVEYLVVPRFLAIKISMPILVAESIILGILAAQFLTVNLFGVPEAWFRGQLLAHTGPGDVWVGLIKGWVYGMLIALISCRQGLDTTDGAVGVGRTTTSAVVRASMGIMIANLFLTLLLNQFFPLVSTSL